jgi:hypothetical protein
MEDKIILGATGGDKELLAGNEENAVPEPATLHENNSPVLPGHLQSLLDARGIGAELANGEDPDDYIRRLREGWD